MGVIERVTADVASISGALRTLRMTTPIGRNPTRVFPHVIGELAARYGDAPALISARERLSYRELHARANRYARWALAHGIGKGDGACLFMPNRPEYMAAWLGLTEAGTAVALINTNLAGAPLAHCINVVGPKLAIVAGELAEQFSTALADLGGDIEVFLHGEASVPWPRIDRELDATSGAPLTAAERPRLTVEDRALYIYTSGTTGLPKAANMNHYRLMLACFGFAGILDTKATDRMYNCLPMYHTAGGLVATGALLVNGGSVVIREKFSTHEFWDDVVHYDCTIFQYIGELCRYLVNSPPQVNETRHRLRLACGNGLRPDVWPRLRERFRIPHILEFYAATEGNVAFFNFDGKEGAIGRIPWFFAHRFPIRLIRVDAQSGEPVRDRRGLCIECGTDEVGEAIGKIVNDPAKPGSRFEGYASAKDTGKKILRDVLASGDLWFRTGDLMRRDADGYYFFVDRIGDTFRWKGENVSTAEVAQVIGRVPGIVESNVYGVTLPGAEGRAGMAALVVEREFDLAVFRAHLQQRLPSYARPIFVRIQEGIEVTATFKQKKANLVNQGFDPSRIDDAVYFNDPSAQAFVRLDLSLYRRIMSGEVAP